MANEKDDILLKLAPSIVEIISDKQDPATLGTGFVITDDGLVVTCRHVVTDSEENTLMNRVKARFYSDFIKADTGQVGFNIDNVFKYDLSLFDEYKDNQSVDLAFFKFDLTTIAEQNRKLVPVKLDDKVMMTLTDFASIGFKKAHMFTGLGAYGTIGTVTREKTLDSLLSPKLIELHHNKTIQPGMSGAPVFDGKHDRVVGIITERYIPVDFNDEELALAIPVESMIELYPKLKEKNQGLTVLSKFLRAIGEDESSIYKWINEVYVPPLEYEEIKECLQSKRIVLITGTREYGKTYTATRLLWEYFRYKGCIPKYIRPKYIEESEKDRLEDLERELRPNHIVYLEDPFGKEYYVKDEALEDAISNMIQNIEGYNDTYVVITSRQDVSKEFHPIGGTNVNAIEVKLGLENGSYDDDKRLTILLDWAKATSCKWLADESIKSTILGYLQNKDKLPTPLSIKDFVIDNIVKNSLDKDFLLRKIDFYSQATEDRFAQEMWYMSADRILFLAFPLLLSTFDIAYVQRKYGELSRWLKNELNMPLITDFWDTLDDFKRNKIKVINNKEISFSHPSYLGSIDYILSHPNSNIFERNIPKKIVSKVLEEVILDPLIQDALFVNIDKNSLLIRTTSFDRFVGLIIKHYDELSHNLRELLKDLLLRMSKSERTSSVISHGLFYSDNNRLPRDLRYKLLDIVAKEHPYALAHNLEDSFDKLPNDIRHKLLDIVADNHLVADFAARIILDHINGLPIEKIRDLFLKMASKDEPSMPLGMSIGWEIDRLPLDIRDELLEILAGTDGPIFNGLVTGILEHYNNNPEYRTELLLMMASNERTCNAFSLALSNNFFYVPADVRNKLLEILADSIASSIAAEIIIFHFNDLPKHIKKLLFKIINDLKNKDRIDEYRDLKNFVVWSHDNLPRGLKRKLLNAVSDDL